MQYKYQILELLANKNEFALFEWIEQQPVLEQVDILNEFKEVMQEMLAEVDDESQKENIRLIEKQINLYQEAYLDEQLEGLKLQMAIDERDKAVANMDEAVNGIRIYLQECIESNAENANEMKELAKKIIESEKETGVYNPNNWLWFKE